VTPAGPQGSVLRDIPRSLPEELCDVLVGAGSVRIERIVSRGHASPEGFWYDQPQAEFVLVVRGRAGVRFEGEPGVRTVAAGEYLNIPAGLRHRVEWTAPDEDTVWLAVHYPPSA